MGWLILVPFIGALWSQALCFQIEQAECHKSTDFQCINGKCIPKAQRCDEKKDCTDGSDESGCDMFHCLEPHWFKCQDGECIVSSFVCDGSPDCINGADEVACIGFVYTPPDTNTTCKSDEWMCTDLICIPIEWVCNDQEDCLDGSDEKKGCVDHHPCDGFRCVNGRCIDAEWVCDGAKDCSDNSDEINCDERPVSFMCTLENGHFPCRDNKSCIPLSKVCDNTTHCHDGSDEGPQCQNALYTCANVTCGAGQNMQYTCAMTPAGPKCICPKGYHDRYSSVSDVYVPYNRNEHCMDIDECNVVYGVCSQKCINIPGSYMCLCDDKYQLQSDGRSCKVIGGEGLLLFSSKINIRGLFLESKVLTEVAAKLRQVVGVGYDGNHVYWTDVYLESESIVRSREDGSEQEILITAGLSSPEDLEVDWYTGNIYFTDAELMHIGVCTNNGHHCAVIVNENIHKPRGIALYPAEGKMYWSDWGASPQISTSYMDGSEPKAFITENIRWPNGIDLDIANNRLYWVDAKLQTVESIRLDGTDRRMILQGVSKHPYAISVFEDRIYWSDWRSYSIQSCEKFKCKHRTTIAKEKKEYIYGVYIYHSALQPKKNNPCEKAKCTHICLLKGADFYSCACPEGKELNVDQITCRDTSKRMELLIGAGNLLVTLTHQILGKHDLTGIHYKLSIDEMVYDSVAGRVIIADNTQQRLFAVNLIDNSLSIVVSKIGKVEAMDFDPYGNNLYWVDSQLKSVEIFNLHTNERGLLLHDLGEDTPIGIALVPTEGVMFIAFRSYNHTHIDRMYMDAVGGRTHVIERALSFTGAIKMVYDKDLHRVFWSDQESGNLESTSVEGDDRHSFRSLETKPIGLAILHNDVFWSSRNSRRIYWSDKHNTGYGLNKKIALGIDTDLERIPLVAVTGVFTYQHPCRVSNGNCSHICIPLQSNMRSCICPPGLTLIGQQRTQCMEMTRCDSDQFKCENSNKCIPRSQRCNDVKDCDDGEDEEACDVYKAQGSKCEAFQFRCNDGHCIDKNLRCDLNYNCPDKSDEDECDKYNQASKCSHTQFECEDGPCIDSRLLCDHSADCIDGSDERHCESAICTSHMFQCQSGSCLPEAWECDGEIDCVDGSDEHSSCKPKKCLPIQYTCTNNRCINPKLKCDQNDDCGDNSDEINCSNYPATKSRADKTEPDPVICIDDMFLCDESTEQSCLPYEVRCNGTAECQHGEDERNCNLCQLEEFTCTNKKCITKKWVCDGTNDCGDKSDEGPELCAKNGTTTHLSTPNPDIHEACADGFKCKSGDCLDIMVVCNGQEDCYDGSDENGACSTPCVDIRCQHECRATPNGPQCYCKEGYKLSGDNLHCTDIDECGQYNTVCSQMCNNIPGSFHCSCYDGYVLRSDKRSCKAVGGLMSIYYSSGNQIRQLSQSPPSLNIIYTESSPQITGIDISVEKQTLYFSIELTGQIYSQNLKTGLRQYVTNIGNPSKIAIDWITENLYFIDNENNEKSLKVCHMDKQKCALLIQFESNIQISSLAVDSVNRVMFYTVTHWYVFNNPTSVIYKTNLDGTKITELLNKNLNLVTGLSPDYNKKILYFTDQKRDILETVDYNGKNRQVLIQKDPVLTTPTALAIFEDYAYTIKLGSSKMIKCKLFGKQVCSEFDLYVYNSDMFTISQQSRQRLGKNVCIDANCTLVCVPADLGPKCLCHGGKMIGQGVECPEDANNTVGALNPKFGVDSTEPGSISGWVTAIIILAIISLLLLGSYFYYKRRRASGQFDFGIRFHNPVFGFGNAFNSDIDEDEQGILETLKPGQSEYINPEMRRATIPTLAGGTSGQPLVVRHDITDNLI